MHDPRYLVRMESPIGRIEITSDGEAIATLSIEQNERLPLDHLTENPVPVLITAQEQLREYFSGQRTNFDLPLALTGTAFQKDVWQHLMELSFGSVLSYGEIGQAMGRPSAGRAVGGAVGANPVPIIVPCHRVLASNQQITGYSGGNGIPTKAWLLDHEGINYRLS